MKTSPPQRRVLPDPKRSYAARTAGITGSVIDASTTLLQEQEHDVIRLAMGSPAAESIPTALFQGLLAAESGVPDAFDYAATEGDPRLRAALLATLRADGDVVAGDELLVTTGGMQGLDLVCKLFVGPGDLVVVESPTYTNGAATITGYEGRLLEAPLDDDGLDVDALAGLVAATGRTPKLIYTVPTHQNPSGTSLSVARRLRLLELAAAWGAVVLEDDPYGMLGFDGDRLPSLRSLAQGDVRVIGVHTFSKILAPGLRVGWVIADPPVIRLMVDARQAMDTCTNVVQQRLVARFLEDGHLGTHLAALRAEYARRSDAMRAALAEELAGLDARWTAPRGGFFVWLTLPDTIDTVALFPTAIEEGVAYIPGSAFSVGGGFGNALRLAFSAEEVGRARLGVQRLRRAIDRQAATEEQA